MYLISIDKKGETEVWMFLDLPIRSQLCSEYSSQ